MTGDIATNKLRNEEFKIWKKTVPLLYQHIFSVKPKYLVSEKGLKKDRPRCMTFSNKVVPNKMRGVLSVFLFYSLDNEIYEIECEIPLGLHISKELSSEKLPMPQYDGIIEKIQKSELTPKWRVSADRRIHKLRIAKEGSVIAMLDSGALVWFREGTESPICIVESGQNVIPAIVETSENSITEALAKVDLDFDVSDTGDMIIASQFTTDDSKVNVRLISNNENDMGKVIQNFELTDVRSVHCIRFYTENIFAFTDNEGKLSFYDVRNPSNIIWFLPDEKILSFDFSPYIDTLLVTANTSGQLKFWDIRTISSKAVNAKETKLESIFGLNNYVEEPVSSVDFSATSPSELITVGYSGSVYHWDISTFFQRVNELADDLDNQDESYSVDMEEIQTESLVFYHTGGSRRHLGRSTKKNSVANHPLIEGLIGTIDTDGLVTVYKPFTGAIPEPEESKD
ncbi:Transcriptional modulator WTM2 [Nakaseomyces bracarensis]|uniref:Transcriptional modulator WTM2 n=1 Tax=Nakaseomyces bracarensis TaxID=273131 RepID=A0ABR4NU06_9SACH